MPLLLQRAPIKKRRSRPRRGRVVCKPFLEWIGESNILCLLHGRENAQCGGRLTIHHVREFGSPKSDRSVLRLCEAHHLHDFGPHSIERLGKAKWCAMFDIDIRIVAGELYRRYQSETRPNE